MLSAPDQSEFYLHASPYALTALNLKDIYRTALLFRNICTERQVSWAIIGGAAVALHLHAVGHPEAEKRVSCDFDVAATEVFEDRRIRWIAPLLGGGMIGTLATTRVDCLVRKGSYEPLRCLQNRLIATANAPSVNMDPYGRRYWPFPVATPDALCALKLCIDTKSFRPKDRWDCRLLLDTGLANLDGITQWLQETISNRSIRDEAQLNIERLAIRPRIAA